jgi:VanZ family protein
MESKIVNSKIPITRKLRRDYLWPVLIVTAIFLVSSASKVATPSIELYFSTDKIAHFLVFGLLATSIIRIPAFKQKGFRGAIGAILVVSIYGGLDEFRQSFTPGRSVEFGDWIADTLGAVLAVTLYMNWSWYRKILESRPKN